MPQRCKCKFTGEWGNVDIFIKTEYGYFKDEESYHAWLVEKRERERIHELHKQIVGIIAYEFLGCPEDTPPPGSIMYHLKKYSGYSFETIYETIKFKYDDIKWAMEHKEFRSVAGQVAYIFAIISNNILEVHKKMKLEQERAERRRKLHEQPDLATEMIVDSINSESETSPTLNKNKNLKKFLEEGDDY